MIFNVMCEYAGQQEKVSKKTGNKYYIVRIEDETTGQRFECISQQEIKGIVRHSRVFVEVEMLQGQYPKYNLISIAPIN